MARIFLVVLKCLPKTWASSLAKKFSTLFYSEERIVREIYDFHYNKKEKALKNNFAAFSENKDTKKKEISCSRFELQEIEDCRNLALAHAQTAGTTFVGYACTKISYIQLWPEYSLKMTPNLTEDPPNLFHLDIYNNSDVKTEDGEANKSELNFQREIFKEIWKIHLEKPDIEHREIRPFLNLRDYIFIKSAK